jgi:hypothetical protein
MEVLIALGAIGGFLFFAVLVIHVLFEAERDELRSKDKRYYYKKYLYHNKQAKKAYKKYQSLNKQGRWR